MNEDISPVNNYLSPMECHQIQAIHENEADSEISVFFPRSENEISGDEGAGNKETQVKTIIVKTPDKGGDEDETQVFVPRVTLIPGEKCKSCKGMDTQMFVPRSILDSGNKSKGCKEEETQLSRVNTLSGGNSDGEKTRVCVPQVRDISGDNSDGEETLGFLPRVREISGGNSDGEETRAFLFQVKEISGDNSDGKETRAFVPRGRQISGDKSDGCSLEDIQAFVPQVRNVSRDNSDGEETQALVSGNNYDGGVTRAFVPQVRTRSGDKIDGCKSEDIQTCRPRVRTISFDDDEVFRLEETRRKEGRPSVPRVRTISCDDGEDLREGSRGKETRLFVPQLSVQSQYSSKDLRWFFISVVTLVTVSILCIVLVILIRTVVQTDTDDKEDATYNTGIDTKLAYRLNDSVPL